MNLVRFLALLCAAALILLAAEDPSATVDWRLDLVYATPGGVPLKLDLALPVSPAGLKPLVVCVHGGAWISGNRSGYAPVLRMLAERGYAAASIEYRLAPEHRVPSQVGDIASALKYLADYSSEFGIDSQRVALLGDSAGGHLVLLAGLKPPAHPPLAFRIRTIINVSGVTDLTSWRLATTDGKIEGLTDNQVLEAAFGTSDRSSPVLKDASPVHWIQRGSPYILTVHGESDVVVPVAQAQLLHRAIEEAGVAGRLEIIEGAGHNFQGANLERAFSLAVGHLDSYLHPSPVPSFERIDAHAHVGPPPAAFLDMLKRLKVRILNVTLVDALLPGSEKPEPQATWAAGIARHSVGRISWASPMDPSGLEAADWAAQETRRLMADFDRGAVAVKLYKSVGLQLKNTTGEYVLPDHPAFSPVLEAIAAADRTLLAHLAEPRSSWWPLDPADPHYSYYKSNPEWHMYLHPERPTWEAVIDARDRLLRAHPALRVVGCHLGSMEHDVDEVARRLDRYPNFAVDTAARMPDLMRQPREKVRGFVLRYQDRILWGTDMMELEWQNPDEVVARWEASYARDWKYFSTAEMIPVGNQTVQGLALPETVLHKIFRENALRWIPGLRKPPTAAD